MTDKPENPTNADLYGVLGDINEKLGSLDAKMGPIEEVGKISGKMDGLIATQQETTVALISSQQKTNIAIIALAGATLGLKLMGTPPLVVISRFINMFVFCFTALIGFSLRKRMGGWHLILIYGIGGVVGNLVALIGGENLTSNLRIPVFVAANLSLLLFVWNWDRWDKNADKKVAECCPEACCPEQ